MRKRSCGLDSGAKTWESVQGQYPIGGFIADFCCSERKLVVELDGAQHAEAVAYDARRTEVLNRKGFQVLRFWNGDVMENIEGVLERILEALKETALSPRPSPAAKKRARELGS